MEEKKRAYISVYDKRGIVEFCRYLLEYGYELIATEGTAQVLKEGGIPVLSAHDLTGYPEPLGGVRAVHPAIYTGIIAGGLTPAQRAEIDETEIYPIRLVVVNLYPFKADMEAGRSFEEAASHIDAGGVALLDAAAKHFLQTVAVCDPDDYDRVLCALAAGCIDEAERKYLMYKAFSYTASYNALVAQYLSHELDIPFPQTLTFTFEKAQDVRYGENPHQRAAIYREPLLKEGSLARAKQLAGPALTYNCVEDLNTALELVKEFDTPAAVASKHCAVVAAAVGESLFDALALLGDDVSHAIVALNGIVDTRVARCLAGKGAEAVLAVGFTPEAMAELAPESGLILMESPNIRSKVQFSTYDMTKIYGGLLVQTYDTSLYGDAEVVSARMPTEAEERALAFNYRVAKHARSSAVVIGDEAHTVGVGTGQANRVRALTFALALAGDRAEGMVAASDGELVTADFIERCHAAGVTAIVANGVLGDGAKAILDEYGMAMRVSGDRHFKN